MPKALKNIVDEVVIPEEPVKGEDFNEDVHNERIVKKISGKMSVNSWFKSLFFRPDEPFNPVLLSVSQV